MAQVKTKKPGLFKRLGRFFKQSWSELKKVSWPNFNTVVKNTGIVLAVVLGGIEGTMLAVAGGIYLACFVLFVPCGFCFCSEAITLRYAFYKKEYLISDLDDISEGYASIRFYPRGDFYKMSFVGKRTGYFRLPKNEQTRDMVEKYVAK